MDIYQRAATTCGLRQVTDALVGSRAL